MSPLAEKAIENGMPLLTHSSEPVGHTYPGKGKITPGVLYKFIQNFPDLKIILAHWGGGLPFYALMPEVGKYMENVYFDTAASPFLYKYEIFKHVAALVGVDKILFGSDYPLIKQKRIVDGIQSIGLTSEDRDSILGINARKLLNI
jgi:hypothetical protein